MSEFADQAVAAWTEYVDRYIAMEWRPYLLSFMFEPLPGSEARRLAAMAQHIERAYAIFVTRVVRKPRKANRQGHLPLWLCSPDLPVVKHRAMEKTSLRDLNINDGLHYQAIALLPPWSRLADLAAHFESMQATYNKLACLERIHAKPITHTPGAAVAYTLKQNTRGRFGVGDNFILPRSRSELAVR